MRALILVGGKGTRLYPLTKTLPKPMAPIANRPHLHRVVDWLKKHGISEVILTLHCKPRHFTQYFGDGKRFGVLMHYLDEPHPLGTGGAIRNAEDSLPDTFLCFNGDILTDLNLTRMIQFHREKRAVVTISLQPVPDPTRYGVVELDASSRILRFVEKPSREEAPSNLINAGTYVMEPEVLKFIPRGVKYSVERGLFPTLIEQGYPLYGFKYESGYWMDIGNLRRYLQVNIDALSGRIEVKIPGREVKRGAWIEERTEVEDVDLRPPVCIGRDCKIRKGAVIGPFVAIGAGCEIGEGTEVRESVIWPNCKIGSGALIEGALISSKCVIEDEVGVGRGTVLGEKSTVRWKSRLGEVALPEGEGT